MNKSNHDTDRFDAVQADFEAAQIALTKAVCKLGFSEGKTVAQLAHQSVTNAMREVARLNADRRAA